MTGAYILHYCCHPNKGIMTVILKESSVCHPKKIILTVILKGSL